MALPVRAWKMTPLVKYPAVTTVHDKLVMIDNFITNYLTHWSTSALDPGVTKEWLEVKALDASMANFRLFICGTAAGGAGVPTVGLVLSPLNNTNNADQLYCTIAPDVGGTYPNLGVGADWKTVYPWTNCVPVVNARWLAGYGRWAYTATSIDAIWALECEDMLLLVLTDVSSQYQYPLLVGAFIEAPNAANGDVVRGDEGIYGQFAGGYAQLGSEYGGVLAFKQTDGGYEFMWGGHNLAAGVIQYQSTANLVYPYSATSIQARVDRMWASQRMDPSASPPVLLNDTYFSYRDGRRIADPIVYRWRSTAVPQVTQAGWMRQIGFTSHGLSAVEIRDSSDVVQGYTLAPSLSFYSADTYFFSNSAIPKIGA